MRITEMAAGGLPLDNAKMVSRSLTVLAQASSGTNSCEPSQIIFTAT